MDNKRKYSLILQGGAEYGVCYFGMIDAMFDANIFPMLKQTVGTSVGSIFALLISIIRDRTSYDLFVSKGFSLNDAIDKNILLALFTAFTKGGVYDIRNLVYKYVESLEQVIGIKNPTLLQCYNVNKIACTMVSFDMKASRPVYFNSFVNPNMRVLDCIAASCNIPFLFEPIYIDEYALIDGAFLKNLDFSITDRDGVIDEYTISVNLVYQRNINTLDSVVDTFRKLIDVAGLNDARQRVSTNQSRNVLLIPTVTPKKILLTPEEKVNERENSYTVSKRFFSYMDIPGSHERNHIVGDTWY
jgi:predicted acylesterase/phospholipase RssA